MKVRSQDRSHCFKHAHTFDRDLGCPECRAKAFADELIKVQYPNANRVTHPQLM